MHSRATDRRSASKCQGKWPDQTRPSVRVTRGAGSGRHLASVLQEGRENANIDAVWDSSGESGMNRFKTPVICTAGFILVGSLFAAYVVGSRVINPLNTTWLSGDPPPGDPAMNQLGWSFFRKEDRLTFPIGWSDAIGFPIGEPIAYMDTIPILAAAVWPFRHVLPESFQYIGPLFLVHCVLQLYFGYRISLQ